MSETITDRLQKASKVFMLARDLKDLLSAANDASILKNGDDVLQLAISSEMVRRKMQKILRSMDNIDKFWGKQCKVNIIK